MFHRFLRFSFAVAAPLMLVASGAFAASPAIESDLAVARYQAVELRTAADSLTMLARQPMDYSVESHAATLARVTELSSRIAKRLDGMNDRLSEASPAQAAQIQAMEIELIEMSRSLQLAVKALDASIGVSSLHREAYQAPVAQLYESAKALTQGSGPSSVAAD